MKPILRKYLTFTLLFSLLFLLYGCLQPFVKKNISQDTSSEKTEANIPESKPQDETVSNINPEVKEADSPEDKQAVSKKENNPPPPKKKKEPFSPDKKFQPTLDNALDFCQAAQEFWQKGDLENALEALDRAYALILDIDTYDKPKLIQQKEDLRFLISKRILEIYASDRKSVV